MGRQHADTNAIRSGRWAKGATGVVACVRSAGALNKGGTTREPRPYRDEVLFVGNAGVRRMRGRILTGDRPTGKLHLGHWVGTLQNRVRLQREYECFFIVADYHILTTRLDDLGEIEGNVRDMVLDYLAAGIDPE